MKKLLYLIPILLLIVLLQGCYTIGAYMIGLGANTEIEINSKYAKSYSPFSNGIYFERLEVVKMENNLPKEYYTNERFSCGRSGGRYYEGEKKLFFNRKNKHYQWKSDTLRDYFRQDQTHRTQLPMDSLFKMRDHNYLIWSKKTYETCPFEFIRDSWYYVEVFDQRITSIYLYVDKDKKFKVYKTNSGISPI